MSIVDEITNCATPDGKYQIVIASETLQQILEIERKAEEYDELINGRYGILELNEKISRLRDENRNLKQELELYKEFEDHDTNHIVSLKKELYSIKQVIERVKDKSLLNYMLGKIMHLTRGKIDPKIANMCLDIYHNELKRILSEVNK